MKCVDRGMALNQDSTVKSSMAEHGNPSHGLGAARDPVNGDSRVVSATNKLADFDSGDDDREGGIFGSPTTEYSEDTESDLDANFSSRDGGPMENPLPCPARGTKPIDIVYPDGKIQSKASGREGLQIQDGGRRRGGDWRGNAWERKRGQVLVEGFVEETQVCDEPRGGTESIDCEGAGTHGLTPKTFSRAKSLTDEDLDELKGCLDLGFGFNYDEIPELCNTLPALELCYSISQKFQDDQQKSPVSNGDAGMSDTSSNSSYTQSPIANWKISSPGDRPEQVKARLKFWAQAVACTVRLCS